MADTVDTLGALSVVGAEFLKFTAVVGGIVILANVIKFVCELVINLM